MNTDPLWQGLAMFGIAWGFITTGILAVGDIDHASSDDQALGCLVVALPTITFLLSALYIFWYLHVKII